MQIPFFRPSITEEDIAEVVDSLRSGWTTTGPKARRFESEFAEFVGSKYAVALNSCTAALHLALGAIGLKRGETVIVPTFTFAATAEVVRYFDATPVFVDCDDTLCISPDGIRQTILSMSEGKVVAGQNPPYGSIRAIIPVHYGGFAAGMSDIVAISDEFGIPLIEDCAHTTPGLYRGSEEEPWKHTGRFGLVGCFSFYANKCITTGEGGMATTDDEEIADRIRLLSLHGMSKDAWKRFTAAGSWYYEIVEAGFKYNLTDVAAALGVQQLKRAHQFREGRERVALRYNQGFAGNSHFELPPNDPKTRVHSWHLYPIRLNLDSLTIDRAQFIEQLKERGIFCSVHWMPLHLQPYYRENFGTGEGLFPKAEREWPRLISLPLFPSMTDAEADYVIEAVRAVAAANSR